MAAPLCRFATLVASVLLVAESASATTRTVTNGSDSGAGSLRDTIAASVAGDTINFSAGVSTITLTSDSLSVNHNLTIQGPGVNSLTITRSSSSSNFRIFYFDNGTWTLSGVTISNGHDSVTGGGIYNGNGNLTLNNCIVIGNVADHQAGGIGNAATTTMNNVFVLNNHSGSSGGGGIYNSGTLTMNNCTISSNISAGEGGGLLNDGPLTLTTSTFNDNTGGAIYFFFDGTVQNCTFYNNHGIAKHLLIDAATVTVQSCTFSSQNSDEGVTIYMFSNQALLKIGNSILDRGDSGFNTISSAGGVTPSVTSLGYNLASDNGGGFLNGTGDKINTDPGLDPYGLQYNGGFTDTIALIHGSAAIDAGKSFGLTTDQRGQVRPYDNPNVPNGSGGDGSDIGAYEAPSDPLGSGNGFIVTTADDHDDGQCGAADCTLREAIARANSVNTTLPRPISFEFGGSQTITVHSELVIASNITIIGPGARLLAISGGGTNRVFNIVGGNATNATMSGLTIRDGNYAPSQNQGETRQGGGVFVQGNLTCNDCAFINNRVTGATNINNGGRGGTGQGGAIFFSSGNFLTLNRCTFSSNAAVGAAGTAYSAGGTQGPGGNGGSGQGGAIFSNVHITEITNCTFNGNTVTGGAGGAGSGPQTPAGGGDGTGAAIFNQATVGGGSVAIFNSTISGNTGTGGLGFGTRFFHGPHGGSNGGVFSVSGIGSTEVRSTIIAGNTAINGNAAPDAEGPFHSDGVNLIGIGDQSTGWNNSNPTPDQVGTSAAPINARLGPLQNNGGPTDTMLLLLGSPAIDYGAAVGLPIDQRGSPRAVPTVFLNVPNRDGCDVGAIEMNLASGTDSDGDGMSDDFEKFYGFNPASAADASVDSDGDGLTNVQEFQAGTNPLDRNSDFEIIQVTKNGNDFAATFRVAVPGKIYRLERKDVLDTDPNNDWSSISGLFDFRPSVAGPATITDQGGASSVKHFYRVRVLP